MPIKLSPMSNVDGGGKKSQPDWSFPRSNTDTFKNIRHQWIHHILQQGFHNKLIQKLQHTISDPPLSTKVTFFRQLLQSNMPFDHVLNWDTPVDQPFCLYALHAVSQIMTGPDVDLFPVLLAGVPTGFHNDIPPSHVFSPAEEQTTMDAFPLSVHFENWKSCDDHEATASALLQQEIQQGWVVPYPGSLADAQIEFQSQVAVGKLGIAYSSHRPPRLIMDPPISGANMACHIPEKQSFPSAHDVTRSFPLRECPQSKSAFGLDIKSAHKRIRLHPSERGLMMFTFKDQLYMYKVCPFGAKCSQHWWGRMGGFLVRFFHHLIHLKHALWLFVDDFLLTAPKDMLPIFATIMVLACQVFQVPVSWHKTSLGPHQKWIGWWFDFNAGLVFLDTIKKEKVLDMIQQLLNQSRLKRRHLERFLGLVMWCTAMLPSIRTHLHWLYSNLARPPATQYSCDPGNWQSLLACVSDSLELSSTPPNTSIPKGSKVLAVKHKSMNHKNDLQDIPITDRRIWLRVADPNSHSRKLSPAGKRILEFLQSWLTFGNPVVSMRPLPVWQGAAFADVIFNETLTFLKL